jgi:hypothetical protein
MGPELDDDDVLAASFEPELDDALASIGASPLLPPPSPLGCSLDPDEPVEASTVPLPAPLEPLELEPDTPPPVEAPTVSDDMDAPAAPSNAPGVSLTPSPFDGLCPVLQPATHARAASDRTRAFFFMGASPNYGSLPTVG